MNSKLRKKCPVIILCILFAFWFFIIPAILGIVLYIRNILIDKENRNNAEAELTSLQNENERVKEEISQYKQKRDACKTEYDALLSQKNELIDTLIRKTQL